MFDIKDILASLIRDLLPIHILNIRLLILKDFMIVLGRFILIDHNGNVLYHLKLNKHIIFL